MIDLGEMSADVERLLERHGLVGWSHKVQIEVWSHAPGEHEAVFTASIVKTRLGSPECLIGMGGTPGLALQELALRIEQWAAEPKGLGRGGLRVRVYSDGPPA